MFGPEFFLVLNLFLHKCTWRQVQLKSMYSSKRTGHICRKKVQGLKIFSRHGQSDEPK